VVAVNVIDINMCKLLIFVKCVTFVSDTFTRCDSNIPEILTEMTLALSGEVVHEKLRKSVNICKSYGKKNQWHLFDVDTTYR